MDVKISLFIYFMLIECGLCNVIFERKVQTVTPIDDVKMEPFIHGHVQIKKRQPRSPQNADASSDNQVAELSAANNYGIDPTENFENLGVESSTVQATVPTSTSANVNRRPQSNNVQPSLTTNMWPNSPTVNWPMVNQNQATGGYWPTTNNYNRRNSNIGQTVQGLSSQRNIYFPNMYNPFLN